LRRSQLEAGDVLISIAGTIGRVGLIPASSLPANINQALALVRVDISCMEPEFLRFFLTSEAGKRVLFSQTVQLAQANLSLGQIANAQIPVPSPTEQRRIVSVLFAHESRIRAEEDYCDKLKQLKKGLMHDLVTGRVRVNIRDEVQP
jgi:type I restriction enzyme S subunit